MTANLSSPVSIFALGGLGEVGKNTYCIETEKSIIIIDAGVKFPPSSMPGVNYVIPDYTYLKLNRSKIKALFITHGHEDHIGAIPFIIQLCNIPVIYAPRLAASLIRRKLELNRIKEPVNLVEYNENSIINIAGDDIQVSFFRVTHSIPDAYGIVVDTKEGRIVETGDYKIDLTPVGPDFEINKLAKLGQEGIDLLMSDSTNAMIEGYTPSEKNIIQSIDEIFTQAQGRLIVSTFSSNISRIQQVVETAVKHNRKVLIVGRSMQSTVEVSREYGYIKIPDSSIITEDRLKAFKLNEICILCTGSQGETTAALNRIANGEHKAVSIIPGDTIVFSSSPIPGNGMAIEKIVNLLFKRGANVLTNGNIFSLHSSGHPSKQELRLMLKLANPKYFMPIHGEYRMLKVHGQLATTLGIPEENIFVCDNGDTLKLYKHKVTRAQSIQTDDIYLDGNNINGVSGAVIKDRKIFQNDGLVIITTLLDLKAHKQIRPIEVISSGFIATNRDELLKETAQKLDVIVNSLLLKNATIAEIKTSIKNTAGAFVHYHTDREPMIIPVIMEKE